MADTRFMNEKADSADLKNSVVSICCIMKAPASQTSTVDITSSTEDVYEMMRNIDNIDK